MNSAEGPIPPEANKTQAIDAADMVSLQGALKGAQAAIKKQAQDRVQKFVQGLLVEHHNLKMKEARLVKEREQVAAQRKSIGEKIQKIVDGDWDAVDPFDLEMSNKKEKE